MLLGGGEGDFFGLLGRGEGDLFELLGGEDGVFGFLRLGVLAIYYIQMYLLWVNHNKYIFLVSRKHIVKTFTKVSKCWEDLFVPHVSIALNIV